MEDKFASAYWKIIIAISNLVELAEYDALSSGPLLASYFYYFNKEEIKWLVMMYHTMKIISNYIVDRRNNMAKRIEDIDGKIRVWYVSPHGRFILETPKIDSKSTDNPIGRSIEDIIEKDDFDTITENLLKILGEFVYKWLTDDQYMIWGYTGLDDNYDIVKTLRDELINLNGPCIQRPGLYITNWIPIGNTESYYGDDYDINEVDEDFITISYHICIEDRMYLIEFY